MNDEDLRIEIYKRLGLEVGSLTSESGNDWIKAKAEILFELKEKENSKSNDSQIENYLILDKNTEAFQSILESTSPNIQDKKIQIASRTDLEDEEILQLIEYGNKEVHIALSKHQKLSSQAIEKILPESVYMVKKILIEKHNLSQKNKEILQAHMQKHENLYESLLKQL